LFVVVIEEVGAWCTELHYDILDFHNIKLVV